MTNSDRASMAEHKVLLTAPVRTTQSAKAEDMAAAEVW